MNLTIQPYQQKSQKINCNQSFKAVATKAVKPIFTDKVADKLARVTAGTALASIIGTNIHNAKEQKPYYNPEDFFANKDAKSSADVFMQPEKTTELSEKVVKQINEYKVNEYKAKFKNGIENASTQEILENLGIKCKKDSDGLLIISHYGYGNYEFRLSDLGIDETKLFKDIKIIEGNADFSDSQIKDLGNLESIGGNALFNSQIKDLGDLRTIGGYAWFYNSQVKDLGNLQSIGGNADFSNSQVQSLGNLRTIGRFADFSNSQVRDLGKLKSIGGWAYIKNCPLSEKDFENIQVGCIIN